MDKLEAIGDSLIQHGKENDRIYVIKLEKKDVKQVFHTIKKLVKKEKYGKIFVKVSEEIKDIFSESGYETEAIVQRMYDNKTDVYFMAKYNEENRKLDLKQSEEEEIIKIANVNNKKTNEITLKNGFWFSEIKENELSMLALLYDEVFETYPFPVFEEEYLLETNKNNVKYFGIWHENKLVAASSIEIDWGHKNAEMTDFAIKKEYRGNGLASFLLKKMEERLTELKIFSAYTIARSMSYGMNITFGRAGYKYSGTLINNTQISGSIESMNVWYKILM